ncbi:MAG: alpha-ketoglutarate-dependent dioxygenase AlkB [Cytophagaceae bacterium]|jgi:alkylated DNA repair dioxygenase AlkB|nr:alpha-ketoglutarate-dependent dioxygenase AlkB [Cytophagaceae bacterium]
MQNLLPRDGELYYQPSAWNIEEAQHWQQELIHTIPWQHDVVKMYGKLITTRREVAWFGDSALSYTYSGSTKIALPWTPALKLIKEKVERLSGTSFNTCLINRYHHGGEGMSWHSDDEPELEPRSTIASVSFGAARKFEFKHKHTSQTLDLLLENGSLLLMKGVIQEFWKHQLPVSSRIKEERLNLTFRVRRTTAPE